MDKTHTSVNFQGLLEGENVPGWLKGLYPKSCITQMIEATLDTCFSHMCLDVCSIVQIHP